MKEGYFSFSGAVVPIRPDIGAAFRYTWELLAAPGNWLTGEQRVAVAAETRGALQCDYCARLRESLSPVGLAGEHRTGVAGVLSAQQVDLVHRLVVDQARLSERFLREQQTSGGFDDAVYVEMLSIVVAVVSIDRFHRAMGLALEPLPPAEAGEPSGYRPPGAKPGVAWVPMVALEDVAECDADTYAGLSRAANVIAAMSLVPDGVRLLQRLSAAMYLPTAEVPKPEADGGRALSRSQIELVAGRVSAINDCFY